MLLSILDSAGVPLAGAFEFLLLVVAVNSPSTAWWCAVAAVIGSSVGNIVLFSLSRRGGRKFVENSAPDGRTLRFRRWFLRYGLVTVFIPALLPIPLPMKVFVMTAGVFGTPLIHFMSVVISARILRYFGVVWLGVTMGHNSTAYLKAHAWQFVLSAGLLFLFLYGLMMWRHRTAPPEL